LKGKTLAQGSQQKSLCGDSIWVVNPKTKKPQINGKSLPIDEL